MLASQDFILANIYSSRKMYSVLLVSTEGPRADTKIINLGTHTLGSFWSHLELVRNTYTYLNYSGAVVWGIVQLAESCSCLAGRGLWVPFPPSQK